MSDSTIKIYNQLARSYEKRWESYLNHTHKIFLNHIELKGGETLLDISGGTGLLADKILNQETMVQHFVVNDPSEQMLNVARKRLAEKSNISFSNYSAEELSFQADSFDAIFCLNSFHFYRDQPSVLHELYKLLKPRGRLYLLDWNREGWFWLVNQVINWGSNEHIHTRSLTEMENMMRNSGFAIRSTIRWRWWYWKFMFIQGDKSPKN